MTQQDIDTQTRFFGPSSPIAAMVTVFVSLLFMLTGYSWVIALVIICGIAGLALWMIAGTARHIGSGLVAGLAVWPLGFAFTLLGMLVS